MVNTQPAELPKDVLHLLRVYLPAPVRVVQLEGPVQLLLNCTHVTVQCTHQNCTHVAVHIKTVHM